MARHQILDVFERITTRAPFVRPRALELFCGPGTGQCNQYAPLCEYLEGWDFKEDAAAEFKRNIPQATVKICDAYESAATYNGYKFNVVLVDNSALKAPKFEHFDLFPSIFRLMASTCFVVFTVYPDPFTYAEPRKDALLKAFGDKVEEFLKDWDNARDRFYGMPPLDPANLPKPRPVSAITLDSLENIYREKFEAAGFKVPYTFSCMRSKGSGYVMVEAHMEPISVAPAAEEAVKVSKKKKAR